MSKYRRILVLVGALILFGMSAHMVHAASVTLRAPTVEGTAGGTVDVPIQAVGASGLGALHVEVAYDPAVLKAEAVTRGALAGANALIEANVDKPGRVVIGVVAPDAINGDSVVANVRFQVTGSAGQSSALRLEQGAAWERTSYAEVLVQTEAGQVTIAAGRPGWLMLAAIAVVAALVVLLSILFLARRRRPALQPVYASSGYTLAAPNLNRGVPPTELAAPASMGQVHVGQAGVTQGTYCTQCGQGNKPSARFCRSCGQPMSTE
jgi:hypothetical protein